MTGSDSLIPVLYLLPKIIDFNADWTDVSKHPRIFPCTHEYFDLKNGDHVLYPKFEPAPEHVDKIPIFHPGPVIFSWKSIPLLCHSLIFKKGGSWLYYFCIRESHHTEASYRCPIESFKLGPNY